MSEQVSPRMQENGPLMQGKDEADDTGQSAKIIAKKKDPLIISNNSKYKYTHLVSYKIQTIKAV